MSRPLKLAFVATEAPEIQSWSGIPFHMARTLQDEGVELSVIAPLKKRMGPGAFVRAATARLTRKQYFSVHEPNVLRSYARQVESRLNELDVDAVFSPGTIALSQLGTRLPTISWTDATFAQMVGYYARFSRLSPRSIDAGHMMERGAILRTSAAVYASRWAADSAVENYGADPSHVHVLPFGANLENIPSDHEAALLIANRSRGECRLLFMGVDWYRKGGDVALGLAERLVEMGIPTRLTVIGCREDVPGSPLIQDLGFIDKRTPAGEATIARELSASHFLVLPSRAECFGVVFCEASTYGVPSLAVRTGGIPSAVSDNVNGFLFGERAFVELAAATVATHWARYDELYVPLASRSREEYHDRLNWATSVKALVNIISGLVSVQHSTPP